MLTALSRKSMRKGNSSCQSAVAVVLTLFFLCSVEAAATHSPLEVMQQIQTLIQQGDLTTAGSQLKRALQEFPNESGLHNLMGVVQAQQGNFREAELSFK